MDGSRSITNKVFEKKKKLVMDLLLLMKSAPGSSINVGVMQFSTKTRTKELLSLGSHTLSNEMAVVKGMKFHAGRTTMFGHALMRIRKV